MAEVVSNARFRVARSVIRIHRSSWCFIGLCAKSSVIEILNQMVSTITLMFMAGMVSANLCPVPSHIYDVSSGVHLVA
jgi:hypothetical protein